MSEAKPLTAEEIGRRELHAWAFELKPLIYPTRSAVQALFDELDARDRQLQESRDAAQMHHDERKREVDALTEERDRLTRELAAANESCRKAEAQIEAVDDILERVDPALLDHDDTPACVEALVRENKLEIRDAVVIKLVERALAGREGGKG